MREGYTYDDEMPSSHGSFVNRVRRRKKFSGEKLAEISVDPVTRELHFEYDKSKWKNPSRNQPTNGASQRS